MKYLSYIWSVILVVIITPFFTLYIYKSNSIAWNNNLHFMAKQIETYMYNVQIYNNQLVISHTSDDPKYWLKFLITHNVFILDYTLTDNSFVVTAIPEVSFKFHRLIELEQKSLPEYVESVTNDSQKAYKISFIKK